MGNHNAPHGHYPHLNDEGFDLGFIEAAHYDREASVQVMSPAQRPIDGTTNVEMYASKDVPVLAYPTLYCMACGIEHACAYTHTVSSDMGVCNLEYVKDTERYVPSERVKIVVEKSYTGRISRKVSQ